MQAADCVFCRIFSGKLPGKIIARGGQAIAVLDAFPLAAGHTLIISKSHSAKIQHLDRKEAQSIFELLLRVTQAVEEATGAPATTIAIHNGREAGQEIPHAHVHVIPRRRGDGAGPVHSMFHNRPESASLDMNSICAEITSHLP